MKNIFWIIGCSVGFIIICIAFFNTIISLLIGVSGYLLYIAYFFAIGIIYEIIARLYRLVVKIKNARRR